MIFHLLHMIAGHIHHGDDDDDDDIDEMCWKHKSNNNDNVQVTSVLDPLSQQTVLGLLWYQVKIMKKKLQLWKQWW